MFFPLRYDWRKASALLFSPWPRRRSSAPPPRRRAAVPARPLPPAPRVLVLFKDFAIRRAEYNIWLRKETETYRLRKEKEALQSVCIRPMQKQCHVRFDRLATG